MKRRPIKRRHYRGFTILELLIVIGVIAVLIAIIMAALNQSRAKAVDAQTQEVLGNVRTVAVDEKIETQSFTVAFADGGRAHQAVVGLADQQGLVQGEYIYHASTDDFVVAFPLRAQDGYWCVDSDGVAKRISNEPTMSQPYSCANVADDDNGGSNNNPQITLLGSNPHYYSPSAGTSEPGYQAMDVEDGDLTGSVSVQSHYCSDGSGGLCQTGYFLPCGSVEEYLVRYQVSDSDGNTDTQTRTVRVTSCPAW